MIINTLKRALVKVLRPVPRFVLPCLKLRTKNRSGLAFELRTCNHVNHSSSLYIVTS